MGYCIVDHEEREYANRPDPVEVTPQLIYRIRNNAANLRDPAMTRRLIDDREFDNGQTFIDLSMPAIRAALCEEISPQQLMDALRAAWCAECNDSGNDEIFVALANEAVDGAAA